MFYSHLFAPMTIGQLTLKNRTVMAPMESKLANADGSVSDASIAYYRERAQGGVGMVIVEFTCVDGLDGLGSMPPQLRLDNDRYVAGQIDLVSAIQSGGAKACVQLSHAGRQSHERVIGRQPVAPSAVTLPLTGVTPRALEEQEIWRIVESYAQAARRAVLAGYDAVMLHGAHGYLLTQFLSPFINHRDDAWGGDFERRLRFPLEVIRAVKAAIGDTPLLYRMSVDEFMEGGLTLEDSERIVPRLVEAGVQGLDISICTLDRVEMIVEAMSVEEGWRLPMARRIRAAAGVPVICAGVMRDPAKADQAIANGDTDIVSLGRALLADPQWPTKAQDGRSQDIVPCTSCNWCIAQLGTGGTVGCAENPRCGRELEPSLGKVTGKRSAVVVGGGPGGMAASLFLEEAGFRVELFERRNDLGGGLTASGTPPLKDKLFWYRDYLVRQIENSSVNVHLGQPVGPATIMTDKPEIAILATGGSSAELAIEGIEQHPVFNAIDVLMGDVELPVSRQEPVFVYGGGETGCETAEYLAEKGHDVILITRSAAAQLARNADPIYRSHLLKRLATNKHIRVIDLTQMVRITADKVFLRHDDGEQSVLEGRQVLLAQGFVPGSELLASLEQSGVPCVVIGDANKIGRIGDAVHDAYRAVGDAVKQLEGREGANYKERLECNESNAASM